MILVFDLAMRAGDFDHDPYFDLAMKSRGLDS